MVRAFFPIADFKQIYYLIELLVLSIKSLIIISLKTYKVNMIFKKENHRQPRSVLANVLKNHLKHLYFLLIFLLFRQTEHYSQ